jgi:dolichol-phosphate mannosyltransferase
MHHARGRAVGFIDADLQDPPDVLVAMYKKLQEGYQVVYGVRHHRREGLLKRLAYYAFYRILALMSVIRIPLDSGDFCVLDRSSVDVLRRLPEQQPFWRGLRAWVGFHQYGYPYARQPRADGQSKYSFRKLMALALDGLLSFSPYPLRIATYLGLMISCLAFAGAVFTLLQGLFPSAFATIGLKPAPGYVTIVISILMLGGIQLLCLGIIGEYIARIYEDVKGRPRYVVREVIGFHRAREGRAQSKEVMTER